MSFAARTSGLAPNKADYFFRFGETARLVLGKDHPAVEADFVDAAGAGNEFDLGIEMFFQFRLQPGGPWQVVSL